MTSSSRILFVAFMGCTLATVAALEMECASRKEYDRRCHKQKERDVLEACTLSLDEIDKRDLKRTEAIKSTLGPLKQEPSPEKNSSPIALLRQRSFLEMQPFLLAYGMVIASVSPLASVYQLVKLNPQVQVSFQEMLRLSFAILPQQAALKDVQMTIATPIKKHCNPWAAFALIGVLQGGLYGHSNVHFANSLGIGKPNLSQVFRGVAFAGTRDLVSQGFPFVLAPVLKEKVFDTLLPSKSKNSFMSGVKRWLSVFSMSVIGTYVSQGFHNSQITMQANPQLGYVGAIKQMLATNGLAALWKGAEARVGLLLVVAFLNETLLKKAWQGVEVSKKPTMKRKKPAKKAFLSATKTEPVTVRELTGFVRRPSIGAASGPTTVAQAA